MNKNKNIANSENQNNIRKVY